MHLRQAVLGEALHLFGKTHVLTHCPWEDCGAPLQGRTGRYVAEHLAWHGEPGAVCQIVEAGELCGERPTGDLDAHFQDCHGLVRGTHPRRTLLECCPICDQWKIGHRVIAEHHQAHIDTILGTMRDEPRCLGMDGSLGKHNLCPVCLADSSASAIDRVFSGEDAGARAVHLVNVHLLKMPPNVLVDCVYPGCGAPLLPLELADHLWDTHRIKVTTDELERVHGKMENLAITPENKALLERGVLPICKPACFR